MSESARQLPQLLTIAEAAELLGLSIARFRKNFVNKGLINVISLGSSMRMDRFHPDDVEQVRQSLNAGPGATPEWDIQAILKQCEIVYRQGRGWLTPETKAEYLYVLRCHDAIKVGISRHPTRRVKGLQAATPFLIEIEAIYKTPRHLPSIDVERLAHAALASFHLRGEWFAVEALKLFEEEP